MEILLLVVQMVVGASCKMNDFFRWLEEQQRGGKSNVGGDIGNQGGMDWAGTMNSLMAKDKSNLYTPEVSANTMPMPQSNGPHHLLNFEGLLTGHRAGQGAHGPQAGLGGDLSVPVSKKMDLTTQPDTTGTPSPSQQSAPKESSMSNTVNDLYNEYSPKALMGKGVDKLIGGTPVGDAVTGAKDLLGSASAYAKEGMGSLIDWIMALL